AIIYDILNRRPDTYCERSFVPAADAIELLRRHGSPLRSLETSTPLSEFHAVGITLQHELNYPGVLCLLDLAGIPIRSAQRSPNAPIVIGGGPCAVNPEPLAPFFDAIFVGEAEHALPELADVLTAARLPMSDADSRRELLAQIGSLPGFYIPGEWQPEQRGRFLIPVAPHGRGRVVRRVVPDLDAADFPRAPIVPYREPIHDRAQLEISRGCTRGCRFCQAGMIYRPVRQRSIETLRAQANQIIKATGYDDISLCSLSCTDYDGIDGLIEALHEDLGGQRVGVGLPSMRIDAFSVDLARKVSRVRKTGLTFAPEAGSQRMRDRINKNVTDEDLLGTVAAAVLSGWTTLKLYFMIGLPGEEDDDIPAIADLVEQVLGVARHHAGGRKGRLQINVSVALFIPKPHTPFQWARQDDLQTFSRKRAMLRERLGSSPRIKLSCHDAETAVVEAFLARGDRRCAEVLETAYRLGAFLDPWSEHFSFERWERAAAEHGLDLCKGAASAIAPDAELPWDHIDVGVGKDFLLRELERSERLQTTDDCRIGGCVGCGMQQHAACAESAPASCPQSTDGPQPGSEGAPGNE
ncbi:MAG TPA: TIGR03960 family B12-binding radical SAM protein, partial [Armatimonadetes bacterium]|nr:TIGR03960 family B12-binding radical SAM protein [Armatimonadota bacterium]